MSSFMDVESENIAPYQPRFIPERGSGSVNRPLGSISANASNVGINNNSSMLQASKPFYGRESALGTPSRVGASFCDSMMAEFSPMAINRSSIMPSAYTPTSSVPHRNHAPSMALEPMAVSPMFTALTPTATAKTPMMQGRTCMGRAATPKPSLSLLSQETHRLVSWENPKHTLGAMVAFFSITLLLSSPPCSLLLFLPSLLALALLASALSPFLPAPLPSPASVRLLGSRSLDVLSLTACLVFDLLLDATSGASPSLTFSAATLAWGLSTLGGYISLSAFTLASIALLFSMAPVAAVASHGLSKAAPVTAAVSELPPAARFMVSAAASVAGAYAGFTALRGAFAVLPTASLFSAAALMLAASTICCRARNATPLSLLKGAIVVCGDALAAEGGGAFWLARRVKSPFKDAGYKR